MKLTKEELAELQYMAETEGFKVLCREIEAFCAGTQRQLSITKFSELSDVTALQGEIRGMQKILDFVYKRLERTGE